MRGPVPAFLRPGVTLIMVVLSFLLASSVDARTDKPILGLKGFMLRMSLGCMADCESFADPFPQWSSFSATTRNELRNFFQSKGFEVELPASSEPYLSNTYEVDIKISKPYYCNNKDAGPVYAFSILALYREDVILRRDPAIPALFGGILWQTDYLGLVGGSQLEYALRERVRDMAGQFLYNFLMYTGPPIIGPSYTLPIP